MKRLLLSLLLVCSFVLSDNFSDKSMFLNIGLASKDKTAGLKGSFYLATSDLSFMNVECGVIQDNYTFAGMFLFPMKSKIFQFGVYTRPNPQQDFVIYPWIGSTYYFEDGRPIFFRLHFYNTEHYFMISTPIF